MLRPDVHDVTVRILEPGQSMVGQPSRLERVENSLDHARRAHRVARDQVQQGRVGHDADPTPGSRFDSAEPPESEAVGLARAGLWSPDLRCDRHRARVYPQALIERGLAGALADFAARGPTP